MKANKGFSMLELVFVILIMGIIGKFGTEFLAQAYKGFIFSKINNTLSAESASATEFISTRLENRIKDSIIARDLDDDSNFTALGNASGDDWEILEWVSADSEGFRGEYNGTWNKPNWSAIADIDAGDSSKVISPESNTTAINELIDTLSNGSADINDSAIFFIGAPSDIETGYGWDGNITTIKQQNGSMHPIESASDITELHRKTGTGYEDFKNIYEYYKLAWTANAVVLSPDGNLTYYYNYRPWSADGVSYKDGNSALIMQHVNTFQFMSIGSVVKIQVCVDTNITKDKYSICKEKTIF